MWDSYVADCLRQITQNTAMLGGGSYIEKRFCELIKEKPTETRTAEEIKQSFIDRLGGDS